MIPNCTLQAANMNVLLVHSYPERSEIKNAAWKGCSASNRATVWRILLKCEPLKFADRSAELRSQRNEYRKLQIVLGGPGSVPKEDAGGCCTEFSQAILRQIDMDLPRTHPNVPVYHLPMVRLAMRRILYLFAVLHPETGYVQGMNEMITPLVAVFVCDYFSSGTRNVQHFLDLTSLDGLLTEVEMEDAEADSFWAFSEIIDTENYIPKQPGMHRRFSQLEQLIHDVDPPLATHFEREGCESIHYSFRWMAVLMMREFSIPMIVRLWDALLTQKDGFGSFLVYVSAALVVNWRDELLASDFHGIVSLLLNLPTGGWGTEDIDMLVSQAQIWIGVYPLR
jgi:TBC1 domain family member 2